MEVQQPVTDQPAAPAAPDISSVAREAAKQAVEEALKASQAQPPVDVEKLVQQKFDGYKQDLANKISGKEQEEVNPIHKRFFTDPEGVFSTIIDIAEERVQEKFAAQNAAADARRAAFEAVLKDRPDIQSSESAKNLFVKCWAATNSSKSDAERAREALNDFDSSIEDITGVDMKTRLAKVASVPSASGQGDPAPKDKGKTEQELMAEELKARQSHFKKSRNLE